MYSLKSVFALVHSDCNALLDDLLLQYYNDPTHINRDQKVNVQGRFMLNLILVMEILCTHGKQKHVMA